MSDWPLDFGGRTTSDEVLSGIDLSGKHALVTGANIGIGFETARALAAAGAHVFVGCRDAEKGALALQRIRQQHPQAKVERAVFDLGSLRAVKAFASALPVEELDILVCNAGIAGGGYRETEDGFERTVGVCHIGHFLLVRELLDKLLAAQGRVVMVSSESHRMPSRLAFDRLPLPRDKYKDLVAYGQAKLCNVLHAKELVRRYGDQGLTAYSVHPGNMVTTDIGKDSLLFRTAMQLARPFTKNANQGAATSVLCAAHPAALQHSGAYFKDCKPTDSSRESNDADVASRLWTRSGQWVADW